MPSPLIDDRQIEIDNLFPSPVARIVHPQAERLNAALRRTILERERQAAGVHHSNEGGWQSGDDFAAWAGAAGTELLEFACAMANRMSAVNSPEHGLIHAELQWKVNAWANVNREGHGNALHGHPGSFWSAVYWVDDGGYGEDPGVGGELEFLDPRGLTPSLYSPLLRMRIKDCLSAGFSTALTPSSGTLLMFPSWLLHAVKRFNGPRTRISVAFNFGV